MPSLSARFNMMRTHSLDSLGGSDDSSLSIHRRSPQLTTVQPFGLQRTANSHVKTVMQEADQLARPHVVRNLFIAYLCCMAVVGMMAISGQIIVQFQVNSSDKDSYVVNIAGRQRMLNQRIAKDAALLLAYAGTDRILDSEVSELQTSLKLFNDSHYGLQFGSKELGLPRTKRKSILRLFGDLETDFLAVYTSGTAVVVQYNAARANLSTFMRADIQAEVENIFSHEADFHSVMDVIVGRYDRLARHHVHIVLVITWVTTSVLLLTMVIEALFVFRPALVRMQKLVGERFDLLRASLEAEASARSVSLLMVEYVAHEVEEPLRAAMHGIKHSGKMLKSLLREGGPEKGREKGREREVELMAEEAVGMLKEAQENCRLMSTVVADVSGMRELEEGRITLQFGKAKIPELVKRCLQTVAQPLPGVTLLFEIDENVEKLELVTDVHRLQQVLIGLVSNALKFTPEGSVRVHVSASHSAWVRFEVSDTGIGLSEEACAKILMPFAGIPESGSGQSGKSTGVGLYIVKLLVEALGGSMGVSSKEGEGSTFWVLLPTNAHNQTFVPKKSHVVINITSSDSSTNETVRSSSSSEIVPVSVHNDNERHEGNGVVIMPKDRTPVKIAMSSEKEVDESTAVQISEIFLGEDSPRSSSEMQMLLSGGEGGESGASQIIQVRRPPTKQSLSPNGDHKPTNNFKAMHEKQSPMKKKGESDAVDVEEKCHRGGNMLKLMKEGDVEEKCHRGGNMLKLMKESTDNLASLNEKAEKSSIVEEKLVDRLESLRSQGNQGWHQLGEALGKVPESPSQSSEASLHGPQ